MEHLLAYLRLATSLILYRLSTGWAPEPLDRRQISPMDNTLITTPDDQETWNRAELYALFSAASVTSHTFLAMMSHKWRATYSRVG
jgi:hypothetical protein